MPDTDILIVGGGYAGLMAAARLRLAGRSVILVDRRAIFVHRVRLHEAAAGHAPAELPWDAVLPDGVRRLCGAVSALSGGGVTIEAATGRVDVSAQRVLLATGSRIRESWSGPTVRALETQDDAARIAVDSVGRQVVVIGAGPTGVEVASSLAEGGRAVTLVDPAGLPGLSSSGAAILAAQLDRLGVHRVRARVTAVTSDAVHTDAGPIPADLVVPCPGFEANGLARAVGVPVDPAGRVPVAPDLSVLGHVGLFVAGDAAVVAEQPWVGTGCASAMPLGAHAAASILASLDDRRTAPFAWRWVVKQVAVGRRHGLVQGLTWDGRPTWAAGGRWTGFTKRALNAAVARVPRLEARIGCPAYGWLGPPSALLASEPA